ncbi:ABC transporter permease [Brevibacillus fluminis]|uniref:ABC transporter permease n=1 Tax=Brevibacillus fluminis TaxID=511487 RepID=A0A3M8DBQ6_9BACL|nr:ABC transporter permease [Brevibacillus fluminis]RNB85059.1 ABC transporter permease [Brevibacillus fluminis]
MAQLQQVAPKTPTRTFRPRFFSRIPVNAKIVWGLAVVCFVIVLSICAPWLSPYDPNANDLANALQKPSAAHWFGTDNFGRDIFTRMLYAGRVDLQIGVIAVIVPFITGTLIGLLSGYFGGWFNTLMMRLVDVVISFPFMVLIIAIISILGPGLMNMYIAIFIVGWSAYARIVRGEVLVVKQQEYILAARSIGYGHGRIMLCHILPNVISSAIVFAMSDVVLCILLGASLSFLGLGVQPPAAEWGSMISEGRNYIINAWWIATFPGLAIVVTGLGFSLLGDGLAEKIEQQ